MMKEHLVALISTFTIPSGYIENIASPNMKSLLY